MKIILINIIAFFLIGCTDENISSENTGKPSVISAMEKNQVWPYKIKGNLELFDCGFNGNDNELPSWCVGVVESEKFDGYDDDISIVTCGHEVFAKNNIDIDNTQNVSVWIDKTSENYSERECKFSKVEIGAHVYKIVDIKYNM